MLQVRNWRGISRFAANRIVVNAAMVIIALAIVASIALVSGRVEETGGLGYDGRVYADMLTDGLDHGTANPRMRPLIVMLNQVAYDVRFKPGGANARRPAQQRLATIRTFQAMNMVYAAVLALLLCALLDIYGVETSHKLVFIANVFATIAVTKMFAFYPVMIDLGAYVFVTAAIFAILRGRRPAIVITTVLAVLSREFGLAAVVFGAHRDLRLRVRWPVVAGTYVPAVLAFLALRQWVISTTPAGPKLSGVQGGLLSFTDVLENFAYLADPTFLAFLTYFLLTVFGGISLLVVARALRRRLSLHGETEWLTYAALIGILTLAGSADLWRYLSYALPALPALYARAVGTADWRLVAGWAGLTTVLTQQPWQRMSDQSYFIDWFPYYLPKFGVPMQPPDFFWTLWAVRFAVVAAIFAMVYRVFGTLRRPSDPAGGMADNSVRMNGLPDTAQLGGLP